jgi:FkbM family methyltransferase
MIGKLATTWKYALMGFTLGADIRSKCTIASMLPRLRFRRSMRMNTDSLHSVNITATGATSTVYCREQDIFILRELFLENYYMHVGLFESRVRCIIDLGAHAGFAAIRLATVFPDARISCYEPDPENVRVLVQNVEKLPNVSVYNEAVGTSTGIAEFYINQERHTASSLRRDAHSECRTSHIRVKPLDAIIQEVGIPVDLLKFDIEGFEHEIFSQSRLIQHVKYVVGEIKAESEDIKRFVDLFPNHTKDIRKVAKRMYLVYLTRDAAERTSKGRHLHLSVA